MLNHVEIFATVKNIESDHPNHVSGFLGTRFRTGDGEIRYEAFPYSVCDKVAERFMERVNVGDLVVAKGHLSQVRTKIGTTFTEIVVDEFYLVVPRPAKPVVVDQSFVKPGNSKIAETTIEKMIADEVKASIDRMSRMTPTDSCVKRENGGADNSNMDGRRENETVHGDISVGEDAPTGDAADPVTIGTCGE